MYSEVFQTTRGTQYSIHPFIYPFNSILCVLQQHSSISIALSMEKFCCGNYTNNDFQICKFQNMWSVDRSTCLQYHVPTRVTVYTETQYHAPTRVTVLHTHLPDNTDSVHHTTHTQSPREISYVFHHAHPQRCKQRCSPTIEWQSTNTTGPAHVDRLLA